MKNKISMIILACVLAVSFVLGVTGAVTFATDEPTDNTGDASKDRLIGVFITTEYLDLFDSESYVKDNADKVLSGGEIGSSDSIQYQGKLYAILVDEPYTDPETGETATTKKFIFIYSILYKPCIFKAYRLLNVQTLCNFPCFCPYEPKQGKFFILRRSPYPAVLRKYASLPL